MTPPAKRSRSNAAKPKQSFTPFKTLTYVIGAHRDEKGEIIGETMLMTEKGPVELILYKPDFGNLPQKVEEVWEGVEQQFFLQTGISQNGAAPETPSTEWTDAQGAE